MTEVAGDAAFLIDRRPETPADVIVWADAAAQVVNKVVNLSASEREQVSQTGILNATRFDTENTLDTIEKIYQEILKNSSGYSL